MIALVRGVIAASIAAASIVKRRADRCRRTPASRRCSRSPTTVATKVNGTVITSSPGPMPAASSARCSALVPVLTPMPCAALAVRGELLLERRHFAAERELAAVEHALDGRVDLALDGLRTAPSDRRTESRVRSCALRDRRSRRCARIELRRRPRSARTTRRPSWPSVRGVLPLSMQSTKCSPSTRSASVTSSLRRPHVAGAVADAHLAGSAPGRR